jgi:hypothetical protein
MKDVYSIDVIIEVRSREVRGGRADEERISVSGPEKLEDCGVVAKSVKFIFSMISSS